MTKHYNRKTEEVKRKKLRQNSTYTEKIVWMNLRNRRMLGYKFKRQYSVDKYIIDFYCPELKFAIEVDGISYHSVVKQIYDK